MNKTKTITLSAMLAALVFIATFFLKIPLPQGYAHLGNCFVLISGWVLGPVYGALAAGIGSVMADVCGGFAIYIIPTFIIKALSAIFAYLSMKFLSDKINNKYVRRTLSAVAGGWICPAGYFIFEIFVYSFPNALLDVWALIAEECVGIVCALLLAAALDKTSMAIK